MKKQLLTLVSVIVLFFVGCSSEENPSTPNDITPKLLTKLEQVYTDSNNSNTSTFLYNDSGILTKVDGGNGFFITAVYDNNGNLVELLQANDTSDKYEYENGKMVKYTRVENGINSLVEEYTYNGNLVTTSRVIYNDSSTINYTYEYTNNTIKKVNNNSSNSYEISTYDKKNNPFSGVEYLRKISPNISYGNEIEAKIYSNGNLIYTVTRDITYDSDNYPIQMIVKEVSSSGSTWGETRNYTYNK